MQACNPVVLPYAAHAAQIVAGLEPENTNVFLQMLGSACKVSNGEAEVQRVLAGESPQDAGAASQPAAAEPAARPTTRPSSQLQQGGEQDEGEPAAAEPAPAKLKKWVACIEHLHMAAASHLM
jgi:TRAF3-interacting protein 1